MLCSYGVHDNLDPSSLGVDPEELSPSFAGMNWDDACKANYQLAAEVKRQFSAKRLADLINGQGSLFQTEFGNIKTEDVPSKGKDLVLEEACRDITEYCLRVTKTSRDFMETNPRDKLPKDYKRYPGKMDHTTCVLVRARIGSRGEPKPASSTTTTTTAAAATGATATTIAGAAGAAAATTTTTAAAATEDASNTAFTDASHVWFTFSCCG